MLGLSLRLHERASVMEVKVRKYIRKVFEFVLLVLA